MLASRTSIAFASTVATVGASSRSRISPSAFWARARALSTFALSSSTVNGFVMNPAAPQVERGTEVCLVGRPGHQDDRQARSTSVQLADQLEAGDVAGQVDVGDDDGELAVLDVLDRLLGRRAATVS
jgi:hypothetical protein